MSRGRRNDDDFNESSYVKVNERLSQFRKDYPEGAIHTIRGEDKDGVFFKCLVFRNHKEIELYASSQIAAATGHAYLPDHARDDDKVEEYSETVSIGRALACLGYGVEKAIASAEEMEQFSRLCEEKPDDEDLDDEYEDDIEEEEDDIEEEEQEPAKLKTTRKYRRSSKLSAKKTK